MKNYQVILFSISLILLFACDEEISPGLSDVDPIISIDAFVNDKPEEQCIRVEMTQPFLNNGTPVGVTDAAVSIVDSRGQLFPFVNTQEGIYTLPLALADSFALVGETYFLTVFVNGVNYSASSRVGRVPEIDSISFRFEAENNFFPDSYIGEFWSRDLPGSGDTYWIQAYKNDVFLNRPEEINIAYDAGFSPGGNIDSLVFIPPIRDAVNRFGDENAEGDVISPLGFGDLLRVEIHSISPETFLFFQQVIEATNRPGGFAELFATPLTNVSTNIIANDENIEVVGFFNVAAVSTSSRRLFNESDIRLRLD